MKFKEHLFYLKTDTRAELFTVLRNNKFKLSKYFWNFLNLIICWLKGVEIPHASTFYGKSYFVKCQGSKIIIGSNCTFNSDYTYNLVGINRKCIFSCLLPKATIEIGNNCGFSGTVIGCHKSIKFGNNIKCGANTLITDGDWHLEDLRSGVPTNVLIKDNVWLGVNVTILKGVTIGENSLIGAGSIVTKSIPPNVIAAGNPCKVIKHIQ